METEQSNLLSNIRLQFVKYSLYSYTDIDNRATGHKRV